MTDTTSCDIAILESSMNTDYLLGSAKDLYNLGTKENTGFLLLSISSFVVEVRSPRRYILYVHGNGLSSLFQRYIAKR